MLRRLPHLSVRAKFSLLVGLSLSAIVLIGGAYVFSQHNAATAFEKRARIETTRAVINEIELAIAEARAAAQRFLIERTSASADAFPPAAQKVRAAIERLAKVSGRTLAPDSHRRLVQAQAGYERTIGAAIEAQRRLGFVDRLTAQLGNEGSIDEPDGLSAKLSNAKAAIAKHLSEEMAFSEAVTLHKISALLAAISEKEAKLIASGAPEYLTILEDHVRDLRGLLKAEDIETEFAERVTPSLDRYREILKAWSAAQRARKDTLAGIDQAIGRLGAVVGDAYAAADTALDAAAGAFARARAIANWAVLAAVLVSFAALSAFGYVSGRYVIGGLRRLTATMGALAQGDTEVDVEARQRNDELGAMWGAVRVFRDNAIERAGLMNELEQRQEARAKRQKAVEELIAGFRDAVRGLLGEVAGHADQLQATAKGLSAVATQTASRARGAGAASEEASHNVKAVAAATEELSASIDEISHQVSETSDVVAGAAQAAHVSDDKVAGLAEAAEKIGDVVSLISAIAEQTNLLALNATIEAARAGEAGKGFSVVASEVKELASQTGKATSEISGQIAAIQAATGEAVAAIRAISETMDRVSDATQTIIAAVQEQGVSTEEITRNVQQSAVGAGEVSQNIAGVTEAAGETSQSADQVLSASQDVSTRTQKLRTVVDEFLEKVAVA